jgi:hypothetical protein
MRSNVTGIRLHQSLHVGVQVDWTISCTHMVYGGMPMATDVNFARVKLSFPDTAHPIASWLSQEMQRWIYQRSGEEVKVDIALETGLGENRQGRKSAKTFVGGSSAGEIGGENCEDEN